MAYVRFVPIARVTSQTSNRSVLRRTSANMPRVRRYTTHSVLCLLVGICSFWIVTIKADCYYDDERHEEGAEVATTEPCLNCTCSRGALLCYLKVCPRLPNPPPSGCILLHRYRTCCPELICTEFSSGNGLEGRSDFSNDIDTQVDKTILGNACIANGSVYGPGSAMHSSSFCEYCYCLGGKQICVKPKCLLPTDDCKPVYDATSCCPAQYNCTSLPTTTSSTTTATPKQSEVKDGCLVDGILHPEGGKVLGIGHSVCDNCYCIKGLLRCEPLSCAPPLLGCSPVIKSGECCAASYNCNGTIEIQPEPNYGQFPIVSKEYAKLRKEVYQKKPQNKEGVVTVAPFYVLAESLHSSTTKHRSSGTFGTTRHFAGVSFNPSTTKPFYYHSISQKASDSKTSTKNYLENKDNFPGVYYATTNYEFQNTNYKRVFSTTTKPKPIIHKTESTTFRTSNAITTTDYKDSKINISYPKDPDNLLNLEWIDGRLNRKVDNETSTTTLDNLTTEITTNEIESTTFFTDKPTESETDNYETSEGFTTENVVTTTDPTLVTLRTILNSTDCIKTKDNALEFLNSNNIEVTTILPVDANEINKLAERVEIGYEDIFTTTDSQEDSSEISTNAINALNLLSKNQIASATLRNIPEVPPHIRPNVDTVLNITKVEGGDYEFDYNEPSLPPSLPNLQIIPFVAADALDAKKDTIKENAVYTQEKIPNTSFGYTNLFSPPIETEGGFVPKDPPILENFYDNAVSAPSIITDAKPNNADCVNQEGHQVVHGESVPSNSPCITCTCFYGNIVCQKPTCPIPRKGCRKSSVQDLTLCCPHYVCDNEAPTVVLDRLEENLQPPEVATIEERIVTADPFRDVIRTEPPPDLQSLIVDMMPFFTRKTTPLSSQTITEKSPQTTPLTTNKTPDENDNETNDFDKVLELLFSGNVEEKSGTTTNKIQTSTVLKPADGSSTVLSLMAPPIGDSVNSLKKPTENLEQREDLNEPNSNHLNNVDAHSVGLLKLAGCNIYGRMYRVGRIISELSGPCLECKCTEVGVQCKALNC